MSQGSSQLSTSTLEAGILGLLIVAIYAAIFLPYMPNAQGALGGDYSLHFPALLVGYFWFLQNGAFQIPWFSPATCGGFPYFSDPNVAYHSVPQLLMLFMEPVRALQITFLAFAFIGCCGFYVLARRACGVSRAASALAAVIFTFNGLYAYRMLIGHLTFHAFMLVPIAIAAVLPHQSPSYGKGSVLPRICIAGLCFAYMFQSGFVHGILPMLLAVTILLLLQGIRFGFSATPWLALAITGFLAIGLSAVKLSSELALLSQFPRDLYPLLGIEGTWNAISTILRTLFTAEVADIHPPWKNAVFTIERHELEYGITLIPGMLLLGASAMYIFQAIRNSPVRAPQPWHIAAAAGILLLLTIPLALNVYREDWNLFLKSLPFFRNNFILLRWFSAYIPVALVFAALAFDFIMRQFPASSWVGAGFACYNIGLVLLSTAQADKHHYEDQHYSIAPITAAYRQARQTHAVVPITTIISGANRVSPFANDSMVLGESDLKCYQPLLGYRQERFNPDPLRPGPVVQLIDREYINLKNPICYLYPIENQCSPGDAFRASDIEIATRFLYYASIPFLMPVSLRAAFWINLAAVAFVILVFARSILVWAHHRRD